MTHPVDNPAAPPPRRRRALAPALAIVLLLAAGLGYWLLNSGQRTAAEADAARSLEALGAIVVMDGSRSYVASVNLSTVESADSLHKAIELLPALGRLGSLDASRTPLKDQQLAAIGRLSTLASLALGQTAITDDGLQQLRPLEGLHSLNLAGTNVASGGLAALAGMRQLKILDLTGTHVASGLEPLAGLPQLEWLVLRGVKLADEALPQLSRSTSLTRLSLEGSEYPAASLARLRAARPQLTIDK
ncbi:MAG: hypothetical protein IT424_02040 [Pirellulales bacterium]|nr:hypothetical protein [Pirellulales bacterium]